MGVSRAFMALLVPFTVLGIMPPSPVYPGVGPLPGAPPVIVPVDHQNCMAMRRDVRQIPVPMPYFCHPRDPKGIPFPEVVDQEVTFMLMKLQWSGYKVCTRQEMMPTHRYIPVPVCCPGWQRGPAGKCDMPAFKPSATAGPCLNGGILKPTGKCCFCPPGFAGRFCQHSSTPFDPLRGYPRPQTPGMPRIPPPPVRIPVRGPQQTKPVPISPSIMKIMTETKNNLRLISVNDPKRAKVPLNMAYINPVPPMPPMSRTPNAQPTNRLPVGAINTAYINQLPPRPPMTPKLPYINRMVPPNPAYINIVPGPLRTNMGSMKGVPNLDPRLAMPPRQTAYINRVPPSFPQGIKMPQMLGGIPPNSPRPVIAPPVAVIPTLGINPAGNRQPMEPQAINPGPMPGPAGMRPPVVPIVPVQNRRPGLANDEQCKQILEVGVTRCFRDAGIMAAPRDVFNPQNPDVARSICSQGGRLQPCIMAGETACGSGMRVIVTRRMLASLLNAMGNLCSPRPMMMPVPMPNQCLNGGTAVFEDGMPGCRCMAGFAGEICEIAICSPFCENNGICQNVDGVPQCVCQNGFFGDHCEQSVPVTTVTDPKPVDPPTDSLETSPNPVPVEPPVKTTAASGTDLEPEAPKPNPQQQQQEGHEHAPITKKKMEPVEEGEEKLLIWGYPLWFILAIVLGFFVFMLIIFITCCLCLRYKRQKRSFEVEKEAVKLPVPVLDNVYTVGVVPPIYESKGIPPLSYEEAKGETIKGTPKQSDGASNTRN